MTTNPSSPSDEQRECVSADELLEIFWREVVTRRVVANFNHVPEIMRAIDWMRINLDQIKGRYSLVSREAEMRLTVEKVQPIIEAGLRAHAKPYELFDWPKLVENLNAALAHQPASAGE